MSFDYNPYKHIELVFDDSWDPKYDRITEEEAKQKPYRVYCYGCGNSRDRVGPEATVAEAFAVYAKHIRHRHKRSEADFESWSAY